ncbi:MAG: 50S ribosomal protein L24 [Candidatus Pacebacteria bacterium]|jgi:large subunit ribosomal protein L24|nr:50S ribosomal protein L24 [Candidatus Paceibacterota bacterium]NMB47449.1 50S ribosomal protein L24 [Patescibacteria group bacterium]MDD2796469.1 50S ribosomal protein L24 [Candidatus Paceibacterota bacterium]MDD3047855.1 50S ribosomal protein L24 [Candidatus Paceibacterota bacterium]MDD3509912.1 50S ribosomal protein L24 [Candidatus Paceibacterota bacterium]
MKIKKGDQVIIIAGNYKGKKGQVLKALPKEGKVVVEKVALIKKHIKPRAQGQKGQVIEKESPINVSNVALICPKCSSKTRVAYNDKKKRVCKKCNKEI